MTNQGFFITRPEDATEQGKHGFQRNWAIDSENSGFQDVHIGRGLIPPRTATTPHWHQGCETTIVILSGQVDIRIGPGLREHYEAGPGDFIYVGKGVIHQTLTRDMPCAYIQIRQGLAEDVVEYDPAQDHDDSPGA